MKIKDTEKGKEEKEGGGRNREKRGTSVSPVRVHHVSPLASL
jgi:hypothetical protein